MMMMMMMTTLEDQFNLTVGLTVKCPFFYASSEQKMSQMERKKEPTSKVFDKLSMMRWCCDHAMWPAKCDFRLSSIIQGISVLSSRTHTHISHGVFLSTSNISLYIFLLQTPSFFKVQLSQLLVTERMVANVTNKWKFNNPSMVTSDALLVLG